MSKNVFTPDGGPHRTSRVLDVSDGLKRLGEFEAAEMLRDYATLLRERESASAEELRDWEQFGREIEKRLRYNPWGFKGSYPEIIDQIMKMQPNA